MNVFNQRGQGLIEYLILVSIMAIGAMAIVRVLGHDVKLQFTNIAAAIGGGPVQKRRAETISEKHFKKNDMSNFLEGAASGTDE